MKYLTILAMAAVAAAPPAQAADADAEITALTQRVEVLEGNRAVKKLQRAFAYYVDRGLWGEAADLFADDGTIELGIDGVYAGKDRIREYLKRLHGGQEGLIYGQLNEWITLQPAVSVAPDGLSATARWRDQGMLGQYKKHAEWRDGIYENSYVKQGGVWKIRSLHLYASVAFPPDRGPTVTYQPFPAVQIPPFQAPNPVTGKPVKGTM
jgi:opacity protein-like surface antigen